MDLNISVSKGDLYKFPKDVLVKMLTTIQDETKKKCEEDHIKEIHRMLNLIPNNQDVGFGQCNYENCECFNITKGNYEYEIIYKYKNTSFYECIRCYRLFCENHKTELIDLEEDCYICNQCNK